MDKGRFKYEKIIVDKIFMKKIQEKIDIFVW